MCSSKRAWSSPLEGALEVLGDELDELLAAEGLERLRGHLICSRLVRRRRYSIRIQGWHSTGRTAWTRNLAAPVRAFLATETSSAFILLAATIAALVWANADTHGYDSRLGDRS